MQCRRFGVLVCLAMLVAGAGAADIVQNGGARQITSARYVLPVRDYPHGALGDDVEYRGLEFTLEGGARRRITLQDTHVFEDTAPRLADVTGDGAPELVVVETHMQRGAQLAVYDAAGQKIAATPYIGQRNRWLAPLGAADLDGDGTVELAYIDRPHLAKILRVWRFEAGGLREVAMLPGLTNHRFGETEISGGIRHCGGAAQMIVATGDWRGLVAVTLSAGQLTAQDIGPLTGAADFNQAMRCQ
ncbi:MAG: FG-GAP repeat domain-containing protein [Sulfitobacter sp.]